MGQEGGKQRQYDYLPLTLSIETKGNRSTPLILRGTPLPTKRSQTFSTASDNQKSVEIKVLWGESPVANKNICIGSYTLKDIPEALKAVPQISVTYEVDKYCNVKIEAIEAKSDKKIETTLIENGTTLTDDLILRVLKEAEENREEDDARLVVADAELRVREDQEKDSVTVITRELEALLGDLGIALMEGNKEKIIQKRKALEAKLKQRQQSISPFEFGDLGSIFDSVFQPASKWQPRRRPIISQAKSEPKESKKADSPLVVQESHITLIQDFLRNIDPMLELKRVGAWEAVDSDRPDGCAQAAHSMREVLRQLLDKLAPTEEVKKAPWYEKPQSGSPVTRAMRIRFSIEKSGLVSESSLSLTNDLAAAVGSMYDKLSEESHSNKKVAISSTRMYLHACEAVIGLITIQMHNSY
jgi:hypothetical protein